MITKSLKNNYMIPQNRRIGIELIEHNELTGYISKRILLNTVLKDRFIPSVKVVHDPGGYKGYFLIMLDKKKKTVSIAHLEDTIEKAKKHLNSKCNMFSYIIEEANKIK